MLDRPERAEGEIADPDRFELTPAALLYLARASRPQHAHPAAASRRRGGPRRRG